ncbi:hypothetical protein [Palleronia marisminoris]|uniref:hypothetical protein n=1 Tax=Palleronia marisminoris TaxID=315423 RepID=UPI00111389D5|nr:hypothetical protein [Palleronia marisminoris]
MKKFIPVLGTFSVDAGTLLAGSFVAYGQDEELPSITPLKHSETALPMKGPAFRELRPCQ